jgi:hypothetical protein
MKARVEQPRNERFALDEKLILNSMVAGAIRDEQPLARQFHFVGSTIVVPSTFVTQRPDVNLINPSAPEISDPRIFMVDRVFYFEDGGQPVLASFVRVNRFIRLPRGRSKKQERDMLSKYRDVLGPLGGLQPAM